MSYIDGFVIAVPTANRQQFIEHARHFDALFIELGAIRVLESWGDDVPDGKVTDYKGAVMGPVHIAMQSRQIVAGNLRVSEALQKNIVASGYAAAY